MTIDCSVYKKLVLFYYSQKWYSYIHISKISRKRQESSLYVSFFWPNIIGQNINQSHAPNPKLEFRFESRFFSLPEFKGQFLFCHLCHVRCSKCIELIACEMCSDRIYSFPHFFFHLTGLSEPGMVDLLTLSQGGQIMPTTLLLAPSPRILRPSFGPAWRTLGRWSYDWVSLPLSYFDSQTHPAEHSYRDFLSSL